MASAVDVPVVIVGGGPAGLCASVLLSRQGVRSVLFERKSTTTDHPRAGYHNVRTMELFRQWGIEEEIRANGFPIDEQNSIYWTTRLFGGVELGVISADDREQAAFQRQVSPTTMGFCSQDRCEPILLDLARRSDLAEVHFGSEVTAVEIEDDGGATVSFIDSGRACTIRTRYVVAVDGAHGSVGRHLGLTHEGGDVMGHMMNVQFRSPGSRRLAERRGFMYCISNPEIRGIWGTLDQTDRWVLNFFADTPDRPVVARDFPTERCVELVRAAAGEPDLDVEILTVNPWAMTARLASTYRLGPVFFAGDAAHLFPPTGGLGMNTSVQDVHNLAWKLAHVIHERAGESLLDSYDAERRAVGRKNLDQSVVNAMRMASSGGAFDPKNLALLEDPVMGAELRTELAEAIELQREEFETLGQVLGFSYDSSVVLPDGTEPVPVANPVRDFVPNARPGSRAPHLWLETDAGRRSILDLFDTCYVLLVASDGAAWLAAAEERSLHGVRIAEDAEHRPVGGASFEALYGIPAGGAVLVRPDGHVAWRSAGATADAGSALGDALSRLSGRPPLESATSAPTHKENP